MHIPLHAKRTLGDLSPPNTEPSEYARQIEEQDRVSILASIGVSIFQWLLLAGYLVVPGTFTSLQRSNTVKQNLGDQGAQGLVLHTIQSPPLVGISCAFFCTGAVGLAVYAWYWRYNFLLLMRLVR